MKYAIAEARAVAAERVALAIRTELTGAELFTKAAEIETEKVSLTSNKAQTQSEKTIVQAAASEIAISRLGPVRFSGEFRLRADIILRPAFTNPGEEQTAIPHVQNVRARYRLRFNIDMDVSPWISPRTTRHGHRE
jgi:hypothetical protein